MSSTKHRFVLTSTVSSGHLQSMVSPCLRPLCSDGKLRLLRLERAAGRQQWHCDVLGSTKAVPLSSVSWEPASLVEAVRNKADDTADPAQVDADAEADGYNLCAGGSDGCVHYWNVRPRANGGAPLVESAENP